MLTLTQTQHQRAALARADHHARLGGTDHCNGVSALQPLYGDLHRPQQVVALAPMLCASVVIALLAPHPSGLRRVGWILVAATVLTAVILAV